MAFLKWAIVFAAAFCFAFVIIVTFSQAPFKQPVPAMIFSYQTKAIALYWYVAGALGIGLAVGLAISLYTYIDQNAKMFKKNKTVRELEEKVSLLQSQSREPIVASFTEPRLPVDKIVDSLKDEDI
jgi:hypothetical protein